MDCACFLSVLFHFPFLFVSFFPTRRGTPYSEKVDAIFIAMVVAKSVFEEFAKEIDAKVEERVSERISKEISEREREMAKAMLADNIPVEKIAAYSGLSVEEIARL